MSPPQTGSVRRASFFVAPGPSTALTDRVSSLVRPFGRLLKEVSVLLEALEKRQLELEKENERLKEDLAEAASAIEEGVAARKELEDRLAQRDAQLEEKKCIVFVEKSTSTAMTAPEEEHIGDVDASLAMPPPRDEVPAATVELATLPGSSSPSTSNPTGLLKSGTPEGCLLEFEIRAGTLTCPRGVCYN